jgi:hypothetical protein
MAQAQIVDPTQTAIYGVPLNNTIGNPEQSAAYLQYKANTGDGTGNQTSQGIGTTGGAIAHTATNIADSQYNIQNDPTYISAMLQGQSAFNTARANALAANQNTETGLNRQLKNMDINALSARRQLAGNYAARGMQRGSYGAYYRAQDTANAQQIAAQTDIKDQIAALNQNFLSNYGAIGTDWTGTAVGQEYRNSAIQQALASKLAQYGVA